MNPILRNILAVVAGIVMGGALNMVIVALGPYIIPPPEGVDSTTMEGLKEGMRLFEAKHFVPPFLAHALGTLLGAFVAAKIAKTHQLKLAIVVGCWFLLGGIAAAYMLPSPVWYTIVDTVLAYIPMALFGGKLAFRKAEKV